MRSVCLLKLSTIKKIILFPAYLSVDDVNIVAVDWSALCKSPMYFSAVSHVKAVGQQVALLIDFLVNSGADVDSFHIIGHSLGAHVASFASNSVTTGNITRITGELTVFLRGKLTIGSNLAESIPVWPKAESSPVLSDRLPFSRIDFHLAVMILI